MNQTSLSLTFPSAPNQTPGRGRSPSLQVSRAAETRGCLDRTRWRAGSFHGVCHHGNRLSIRFLRRAPGVAAGGEGQNKLLWFLSATKQASAKLLRSFGLIRGWRPCEAALPVCYRGNTSTLGHSSSVHLKGSRLRASASLCDWVEAGGETGQLDLRWIQWISGGPAETHQVPIRVPSGIPLVTGPLLLCCGGPMASGVETPPAPNR